MKFVVSSSALLGLLQTTNKVISSKNTLPILDYFLFDLKEGVLKSPLPTSRPLWWERSRSKTWSVKG